MNGQAYLYDVRFPSYAHKLLGQSDIVSAVAFHPLHTQVDMYILLIAY